jgi:hypothetical protein
MKTILLTSLLLLSGCGSQATSNTPPSVTTPTTQTLLSSERADVTAVNVNGDSGSYSFNVTLSSDETGCAQYANWWEVLDETGNLIYRRILFHSHPTDQPFTRSGGSIMISSTQVVYVRAHMNTTGYNGDVLKGSVESGFEVSSDIIQNSEAVILQAPQPDGCAF